MGLIVSFSIQGHAPHLAVFSSLSRAENHPLFPNRRATLSSKSARAGKMVPISGGVPGRATRDPACYAIDLSARLRERHPTRSSLSFAACLARAGGRRCPCSRGRAEAGLPSGPEGVEEARRCLGSERIENVAFRGACLRTRARILGLVVCAGAGLGFRRGFGTRVRTTNRASPRVAIPCFRTTRPRAVLPRA